MRLTALIFATALFGAAAAHAAETPPGAVWFNKEDLRSKLPGNRIEVELKDPAGLSFLVGQITDDKAWKVVKDALGKKAPAVNFKKQKVVFVVPWSGQTLHAIDERIAPAKAIVTFRYEPIENEMAREGFPGWLRVVDQSVNDVDVAVLVTAWKKTTQFAAQQGSTK